MAVCKVLAEPSLRLMPKSTSRSQSHINAPPDPAAKPRTHFFSGPTLISDWNYRLNASGQFAKSAMHGEIK
jgi:hypothetical protein